MSDPLGGAPPSRSEAAPAPGRRPGKGPAAFRTISEASEELGVPQHVLRFWETRFAFISPTKRAGGRRFYRPQDLEVLRGVRVLLQDDGYTIKGVQKLHREGGLKRLLTAAASGEAAPRETAASDEAVVAPSAPPGVPGAEPAEERDPETLDLFADAPTAAEPPPAAPRAAPPPSAAPRPVLDAAARARLGEVLDDLEATKAEIDALLQAG